MSVVAPAATTADPAATAATFQRLSVRSYSIQPIRSLLKSEIMALCQEWEVPQAIIDDARIPNCLCGRDEMAAENIELIDAILRNDFDPSQHDPILLKKLIDYVREANRLRAELEHAWNLLGTSGKVSHALMEAVAERY